MRKLLTSLKHVITRVMGEDRGQGLTEYALILALIAIAAILGLQFLGGGVKSALTSVGSGLSSAA